MMFNEWSDHLKLIDIYHDHTYFEGTVLLLFLKIYVLVHSCTTDYKYT